MGRGGCCTKVGKRKRLERFNVAYFLVCLQVAKDGYLPDLAREQWKSKVKAHGQTPPESNSPLSGSPLWARLGNTLPQAGPGTIKSWSLSGY